MGSSGTDNGWASGRGPWRWGWGRHWQGTGSRLTETLPHSDQRQGLGGLSPQHPQNLTGRTGVGSAGHGSRTATAVESAVGSGGGLFGETEADRPSKRGPQAPSCSRGSGLLLLVRDGGRVPCGQRSRHRRRGGPTPPLPRGSHSGHAFWQHPPSPPTACESKPRLAGAPTGAGCHSWAPTRCQTPETPMNGCDVASVPGGGLLCSPSSCFLSEAGMRELVVQTKPG